MEVGNVIENCHLCLQTTSKISVAFVRKQANKVAYEMAKLYCLLNLHSVLTSPPLILLETFSYNIFNLSLFKKKVLQKLIDIDLNMHSYIFSN